MRSAYRMMMPNRRWTHPTCEPESLLVDLSGVVERLAQSVSLGAADLEPALLDALDRLQRVTAELRDERAGQTF